MKAIKVLIATAILTLSAAVWAFCNEANLPYYTPANLATCAPGYWTSGDCDGPQTNNQACRFQGTVEESAEMLSIDPAPWPMTPACHSGGYRTQTVYQYYNDGVSCN